jgi:hypothetical protein
MDQDTQQLTADIERHRNEIAGTLDAMGDRVSPSRIMERRRNRMFDGARQVRDRIMGTVHDVGDTVGQVDGDAVRTQVSGHPLGAGLVSFGVGFLAAAAMPKTETERQVARQVQSAVEPIRDELADAGRTVAGDLGAQAAQAVGELREDIGGALGELADTAKDEARATRDEI